MENREWRHKFVPGSENVAGKRSAKYVWVWIQVYNKARSSPRCRFSAKIAEFKL